MKARDDGSEPLYQSHAPPKVDRLSALPQELIDLIFDKLSESSIVALSQVSRQFDDAIDSWNPIFFDVCACYPFKTMRTRAIRMDTYETLPISRRDLLRSTREVSRAMPLGPSGQAQLVMQLSQSLQLATLDEPAVLELVSTAAAMIMALDPDSLSDLNLAAGLKLQEHEHSELIAWFEQIYTARTYRSFFPDSFKSYTKVQKERYRCAHLLAILRCDINSTFERLPTGMSGRTFLMHIRKRTCQRCGSSTSVYGFFYTRYCARCLSEISNRKGMDVQLDLEGIRHCFGYNIDEAILNCSKSSTDGLWSLRSLATAQSHHRSIRTNEDNSTSAGALRIIFDSCYINQIPPEGLFQLLISHYTCQEALATNSSLQCLEKATDYILAGCSRYFKVLDRYVLQDSRPAQHILEFSPTVLYIKYGPMETKKHVRSGDSEDSDASDHGRKSPIIHYSDSQIPEFSFWYAWDCLVTQLHMSRERTDTEGVVASNIRATVL